MVLSASPTNSLLPLLSKAIQKSPASESRDPGCTIVCAFWKLYPVLQSQKKRLPLSPPLTSTPSGFTAMQLIIPVCPVMFCMKFPSGNFHILMTSGEADANVNSSGCRATARTLFLWLVRMACVLPAVRSQRRTVESCDPVMIYRMRVWSLFASKICQ